MADDDKKDSKPDDKCPCPGCLLAEGKLVSGLFEVYMRLRESMRQLPEDEEDTKILRHAYFSGAAVIYKVWLTAHKLNQPRMIEEALLDIGKDLGEHAIPVNVQLVIIRNDPGEKVH